MSQSSVSSMSQSTTHTNSSGRSFDPLVALHGHRLEQQPDLDRSILSDDEMIDLLKNAKDAKELDYLNMELSKQRSSCDGSSTFSFESPVSTDQHSMPLAP